MRSRLACALALVGPLVFASITWAEAPANGAQPDIHALIRATCSPDGGQRRQAIRVLETLPRGDLEAHSGEIRRAMSVTPDRVTCDELCKLLERLGDRGLEEMVRATRSGDPCAHGCALHVIRNWQSPSDEAISILAGVLRWGPSTARRAALEALGNAGPRAASVASHVVQASSDPEALGEAAWAICSVTSDGRLCVPVLERAYYQSRDPELRMFAIEQLRRFPRDARARNVQIDAIWDEQSGAIQQRAIANLRGFSDPDGWAPKLIEILEMDPEDWVGGDPWDLQVAAATTLVSVGRRTEQAVPFLFEAVRRAELERQNAQSEQNLQTTSDLEDWGRSQLVGAILALGKLPPGSANAQRATRLLERLASSGGDFGDHKTAAEAVLFQLAPDRVEAAVRLRKFMARHPMLGPLGYPRLQVGEHLARSGETGLALEFLEEALTNGFRPEAAAEMLAQLGPAARSALPALEACLDHDEEQVRAAAARAIHQIRDPFELLQAAR